MKVEQKFKLIKKTPAAQSPDQLFEGK